MKTRILTVFLLLLAAAGVTSAQDEAVSIYTRFSAAEWGRTGERNQITRIDFSEFLRAPVLKAPPAEGYLTAVLVDGRIISAVMEKMTPGQTVGDGQASFSWIVREGRQAFQIRDDRWGLDLVFSLEEAPEAMLESIAALYRLDSLNRTLVLQEYREKRVIRIFQASDVLEKDGRLSFGEALAAATLIGDTFQPLYGIHDGRGYLRNLGYLLETGPAETAPEPAMEAMTPNPEAASRIGETERTPGDEYAEFLHRVSSMPGSFPENLYILVKTLCVLREGEDDYVSPRAFLARKWGGNREFALFFFKVLEEEGYDVRLLRVNGGEDLPNEYLVVYKEHESREWGVMAANYWVAERFGNWTRIPALYLGRSVLYQELNGMAVLDGSRWVYPGSGKWEDSFY